VYDVHRAQQYSFSLLDLIRCSQNLDDDLSFLLLQRLKTKTLTS